MVLPHNGAPQCGQISSGISPGSQMSLVQEREHCRQVSLPQGAVIRLASNRDRKISASVLVVTIK